MNESDSIEFKEIESRALEYLCRQFNNRCLRVHPILLAEKLRVSEVVGRQIVQRLKALGVLEEHTDRENHGLSGGSEHYEISPLVLEITNQRKAEAKAWPVRIDHVNVVQRWARSHPVWSSFLIALLVLAASATFGRQLMGMFEKIGSVK